MPIRCLLFLGILAFYSFNLRAQLFTKTNRVSIASSDICKDIINKAAHVTPSARQLKWQRLELTAFLHFSINTFTGNEWGNGKEDPALFNPTGLNAYQWVRVCKEAGFKQVILTAKHHDGFCLWPSKLTEHSVRHSPWKNGKGDVVKEVAEACRQFGLSFGIYLSPWDRNASYFGDSALYNNYFIGQLTELLTGYGKIAEVWFDGANGEGPGGKKQVYDFNRWYALIRRLQPGAVIAVMGPDVRWVGTESGYGRETEWSVVPMDTQIQSGIAAHSKQKLAFTPMNRMEDDLGSRSRICHAGSLVWYPAETDVSIRPGWFYHAIEDQKVKTPGSLMDIYLNSVGRNSVLLLNIPPNRNGLISEADQKSLREWKYIRDKTFARNYLKGAKVTSLNGANKKALIDNDLNTSWTTIRKDTTATITLELSKPVLVDLVTLQEDIRIGQRIEKFFIEYKNGTTWRTLTDGTTVGYKRILQFPAAKVRLIRIRIISSRSNPTLAELGLYRKAQGGY